MPCCQLTAALLVLALQTTGSAGATQPPPPSSAPDGTSVESLLERARARAAKLHSEASGRLAQLLSELDRGYEKEQDKERVDATITEILGFKDAATWPLIEALKEPKDSHRGRNAARALARSSEPSVTGTLESTLAQNGPAEQRARIAWILGKRDAERSIPILKNLLADPDSAVVGQAALALAQHKSKDSAPLIAEKLAKAPSGLARELLTALAQLEDPKVVPQVVAFLETPASSECAGSVAAILKSLKAKELLAPAVRLVHRGGAASEEAAEVIRSVEKVITSSDRDAITALKKVLGESGMSFEVKEECAYALHAAKDPFGKTWLLQPVNDAIRDNPEGATLLRSRARIYLRLKLYRESQRDFEEIKRIANNSRKYSIDQEGWIEMARANAGAKSYQPAADALRSAFGLGARAKSFRDFPEFAEMRKVAKYASLFEGE